MTMLPGMGQKQATFYDPQKEREAQRQRKMAELLVAQGNQPMKNEMAGGMVVKKSPWEFLNQNAQKFYGEYKLADADNKEAETEKRRQEMIGQALETWGSDPRAAAAMLGQDPRTSEMAMRLMQGEIDYERQKERWAQQDALQRELASMRASSSGGNTPAPMQIANQMFELEQAMNNPNLSQSERFLAERQYNLLGQAAKTYGFDRGIQAGPMGGYEGVFGNSGIPPVDMMNGELMTPMGGQTPSAPLNPMQYQELNSAPFNNLIDGLTAGNPAMGQMDPVQAHTQAVMRQQQEIGVSPMQRDDLSGQAQPIGGVNMSPIAGYGEAAASIAAQKKGGRGTSRRNRKASR